MTKQLGHFGESWAVAHLTRLGYRIVERNVRFRVGEIDIVAEEGDDLVFVEVKTRRSSAYGAPEDSIDARRFARLERAVETYLSRHDSQPASYRVDVVLLEVDATGAVRRSEIVRGAEAPR